MSMSRPTLPKGPALSDHLRERVLFLERRVQILTAENQALRASCDAARRIATWGPMRRRATDVELK